jgi:hypothetical protein
MFSEQDIKLVLKNFPKFELCYEIITHKKVLGSSAILAIPEGKKCFAWFTNYKNDNVCFLLEINEHKNIVDVKSITTGFTDKLSLGTIFYGTSFKNKTNNCFCVEDMYYYAGKSCYNFTYLSKLETLNDIFKNEISQVALNNKFTIFGLPLIVNDLQLMFREIQLLPYKVSMIKFRFFENKNAKKILTMKYFKPGSQKQENNIKKEAIFKITADIEPDIYNLFVYKNGLEEYYDIAFIPDYKTSVMMNKLFRNIKENDNLDAIEESDNEDEFEDSREDKYVYLDRSFKMKCEYNNKFKRWVPNSLVGENDIIVSFSMLKNY